MTKFGCVFIIVPLLAGCATASDVQELQDGNYRISARAAPIRGGTTGAQDVAYKDAQAFCASKKKRAVVIESNERDIYQGSYGSGGGVASGGVSAAGNVTLYFKCV